MMFDWIKSGVKQTRLKLKSSSALWYQTLKTQMQIIEFAFILWILSMVP